MRRSMATLALSGVLICSMGLLSGCGDDKDPAADETKTIEITFSGDEVTPSGDRIEVKVGQPIDLVVKADVPGEIHVHAEEEEELPYDAGTTTMKLSIDKPGVVDVESHDLDQVIVQLEVS